MSMLIILLGASGSGKSTLEKNICKLQSEYKALISTTTRSKRTDEIDGVHYNFVSKDKFDTSTMAEFESFSGNYYGTSKEELKKSKKMVVSMEPTGAAKLITYLKDSELEVKVVFLDIDLDTRLNNMKKRGDDVEALKKRLTGDDVGERMVKSQIKPDVLVKELPTESKVLAQKILQELD